MSSGLEFYSSLLEPWSDSAVGHAQVECCIRCLAQGVRATHIIDGRQPHSLLLEVLTVAGGGTMIVG